MKIYTRVVMDMTQDDLPVLEEESFEYEGPMALCYDPGDGGRSSPQNDGFGGRGSRGSSGTTGTTGRSSQTNASGFGLGSPMGGTYGDPGGFGHRSAAQANNARGIGGDYGPGGWGTSFENRDVRNALQNVTRDDRKAIKEAQRMARRNDPNPSAMDTLRNVLDLGWSAVKGLMALSSVPAGPVGMASFADWSAGMIEDQKNNMNYREAAGLPSLSPDMNMTATNPDQGELGVQTAMAGQPRLQAPEQRQDILDRTRQQLAQYDPAVIIEAIPQLSDIVVREALQKTLRNGIPELLQKRNGGQTA